jgi:hypothetical protein
MILLYAFSNPWDTNISHLVLLELQKIIKHSPFEGESPPILSGGKGLNFQSISGYPHPFFQKYIQNNQYDLIIGLGDGMKFLQTIKIETRAINSYRHQSINPLLPLYLDLNLPNIDHYDSRLFSIGANMGTYNCNWIAFQTQYVINTKYPGTKHLFLHLPPRTSARILTQSISKFFQDNQLST